MPGLYLLKRSLQPPPPERPAGRTQRLSPSALPGAGPVPLDLREALDQLRLLATQFVHPMQSGVSLTLERVATSRPCWPASRSA